LFADTELSYGSDLPSGQPIHRHCRRRNVSDLEAETAMSAFVAQTDIAVVSVSREFADCWWPDELRWKYYRLLLNRWRLQGPNSQRGQSRRLAGAPTAQVRNGDQSQDSPESSVSRYRKNFCHVLTRSSSCVCTWAVLNFFRRSGLYNCTETV
jgi:hypothetical protein